MLRNEHSGRVFHCAFHADKCIRVGDKLKSFGLQRFGFVVNCGRTLDLASSFGSEDALGVSPYVVSSRSGGTLFEDVIHLQRGERAKSDPQPCNNWRIPFCARPSNHFHSGSGTEESQ